MPTIIDGTNGVDKIASGAIEYADLPTGSVLQVVHATYSTQVSSSTATFVDTGLTATITPKYATSKILVIVSQNGCRKDAANVNNMLDIRIIRGSTFLTQFAGALGSISTTVENITAASGQYLDSPATTSPVTYKTDFCSRNGTASVQVQYAGVSGSMITLMEIAG